MPWTKIKNAKGKMKYRSKSGKKWSLGMIRAYLAKKKSKGIRGV